jgi:predicted outer membrane protein
MKLKSISPKAAVHREIKKPFILTKAALALCAAVILVPHSMEANENTLSRSDAKFIKNEVAAGRAQVKVAQLGVEKAESSEVRAFAERVFTTHTKANEELSKFDDAKDDDIASEIKPAHASTFQKLEKANGVEFDRAFVSEIVSSHKQNIGDFEELSKKTENSDLKTRIDQMIPEFKANLARAEQLNSGFSTSAPADPTNTAFNKRDRDDKTLTPLDQGSSKSDVEITTQVRKAIIANKDMSVNAQNVKIITVNGRVTLRGPVNNADEKRIIAEIAGRIVNSDHVDNQIDLKSDSETN